jgi:hypothetical protein
MEILNMKIYSLQTIAIVYMFFRVYCVSHNIHFAYHGVHYRLMIFDKSYMRIKKNVSRICKKTFFLKFCMGTPEGHQTSIFNTPKVKNGIYPTKFASSTQNHKKVIKTPNQPIEIKKSQIRVCLVLQK